MPNTLKIKRGLASSIPQGQLAEPLFTTDTYDLYIGKGSGGNQRIQNYIASGTTNDILRGDGSVYTFPLGISSPSAGQVLKYNGTSWVNDSDAGITGTGTTNTLSKFTGATTLGNSNVTDDNNSIILGINTRITSGGEGLRLGADTNGNGYTANTAKRGRINVPQYGTPSSLPIGVIAGLTDSTSNAIDIGGIQGGYALAADVIRFNIGATYNASTSSEVARFGTNGALGIGTTSLTGWSLRVGKNITGATSSYGISSEGSVQSDVTTQARGFNTFIGTQATTFTLPTLYHYFASQGTFGAGSTVTNQHGFSVDSGLTGATNNYAFFSNIAAGSGRWNLYMNGTANNYLAGSLGIGTTSLTGYSLRANKALTGNTDVYGIANTCQANSDATSTVRSFYSEISTQAASYTLSGLYHYWANQGSIGAGSTVTSQFGFFVHSSLVGATNNFGFYGNIPSGTNRWNLYMNGTANNYMAGSLGIGATGLTGYNLRVSRSITGNLDTYGIMSDGQIQSDVTTSTDYFRTNASTQAAAFTLFSLNHYNAGQGTFGASSAVTNQSGFIVAANMVGATNNYGFRGLIPSGTNRWNLYMDGTANNYMAGNLGIGGTTLTSVNLFVVKNITGGTNSIAIASQGTVQSDVTSQAQYFSTQAATVAAAFTLNELFHYRAIQATFGAGSTVSNQYGYYVQSNLTGATNNFGFYGNLAAATGVWNLYMNGTANNYMAGSLGIGSTSLSIFGLRLSKTITGGTIAYGQFADGAIQSDVTSEAMYYSTNATTAASAFTLTNLFHFRARYNTFGATSAVTNQYGFYVDSALTAATNNYGFYGNIASGTNRWNLYMAGTADNHLGGKLTIGSTTTSSNSIIYISRPITGSASSNGIIQELNVSSDVTTQAFANRTILGTAAASFTLPILSHYIAGQGTIGAGSTVTTQIGYWAQSNMIGATTNVGFYGDIASGANRWNLYMNGTADNYLAGSLGIGQTSLTGYNLRISKTLTGATSTHSVMVDGGVQTDSTNYGAGFRSSVTLLANTATSNLAHFLVIQGTFGAGSSATNQMGYWVENLSSATNNYGYYGNITAASGRWNLYMNGTANNYMAGSLGIGSTSLTGFNLRMVKSITGAVGSYGMEISSAVASDVTSFAVIYNSAPTTVAAAFTLPNLYHYFANNVIAGSGSTVTNQYGFFANSAMTGATNNYGFYGNIASGANRWNLYMNGTAANYLAGKLLIGSTTDAGSYNLQVTGDIVTGKVYSTGITDGIAFALNNNRSIRNIGGTTGTGTTFFDLNYSVFRREDGASTGARIGINVNPTETLDVNGTARISGTTTILNLNNTSALSISGSSLTGTNAQSLLDLSQTWNTTGYPTAIKLNITNTASGILSNLMDLQVGGATQFLVDKAGAIKTSAPSGGTAGKWKLGSKVTATVALVTTDYIELEVDGVAYKVGLVS